MIWNCWTFCCELWNHEKIVVVRDDILGNNGACWYILHSVTLRLEKSLISLRVNQNQSNMRFACRINFLQFSLKRINHILMIQTHLVIGTAICKNNNLFRSLFISFSIRINQFQQECHHAVQFVIYVSVLGIFRTYWTECWVYCCNTTHDIFVTHFCVIECS